jgi:hypothetical protein
MWETGLRKKYLSKRILKKVQVAKDGISHTFKTIKELKMS